MKTRSVFQQETIQSTAGKSGNARLLSLFVIVLAEICIPATALGQSKPSTPVGGPVLDSSEQRHPDHPGQSFIATADISR